jgi:hypothetical protein
MKNLRNERGVALVTALCFTMIALAIIMALLYMITWQARLSGAHKRYKTAIEASQGATEIFAKQIIPMVFGGYTTALRNNPFPGITLTPINGDCLSYKLQNANTLATPWSAKCGSDNDVANSVILSDPTKTADVMLNLQGTQAPFTVYAKIVDTVPGNSDLSGNELLDRGDGVTGMSSGVSPKHLPATYRIEVQGQKATNPLEKAKLSVLYAY